MKLSTRHGLTGIRNETEEKRTRPDADLNRGPSPWKCERHVPLTRSPAFPRAIRRHMLCLAELSGHVEFSFTRHVIPPAFVVTSGAFYVTGDTMRYWRSPNASEGGEGEPWVVVRNAVPQGFGGRVDCPAINDRVRNYLAQPEHRLERKEGIGAGVKSSTNGAQCRRRPARHRQGGLVVPVPTDMRKWSENNRGGNESRK